MSEHHSPIKTPKQLIAAILLCFLIPIIVIILLVNYVDFGNINGAGTDNFTEEATKKRIAPVASVNYKDPNAPVIYKTGEEVYKSLCLSCHASGAAGAPKFGSPAEWTARLGQGLNGLLHSVINGKGAMQARAGSSPDDYIDYELARAVVYMANASGGNLAEPKAPAVPEQNKSNSENTQESANANVSLPSANNSTDKKEETKAIEAIDKPSEINKEVNNLETGKKVFEQACIACHGSGVAGAPKLGDKSAWLNRISAGKDALYKNAANGKGAMPPKGGFAGSDEEFKAAIDYMLASVK